jgi:hypothetical protein
MARGSHPQSTLSSKLGPNRRNVPISLIDPELPAEHDARLLLCTLRLLRIENRLTDVDGPPVALKQGARLNVTFEADAVDGTTRSQA